MDLPVVEPGYEPKFDFADEIWIINNGKVQRTNIRSIVFELVPNMLEQPPVLICTGYRLHAMDFQTGGVLTLRPHELYATEAEASELAVWRAVIDVTEEEWFKAIGDRNIEDSLEESDLPICCGNISDVRDLLIACKEHGGLMERDARWIKELLDDHTGDFLAPSQDTALSKIFTQLGIVS